MLWEEQVPLLKQGIHKEIVRKAFAPDSNASKVFPPRKMVFNSMRLTALEEVRVVIIGQDPYFNEHPVLGPEAHGLCFSVRQGIPTPPSLRNIFKEIDNSLHNGQARQVSTDLTRWAEQGVLLLNSGLTVIAGKPNSHSGIGWHRLTDDIIETISKKREHVVFMLWGAFAQKKAVFIDPHKHLLLQTTHPSPLSAHRGFLGSGVFADCNNYLEKNGHQAVDW